MSNEKKKVFSPSKVMFNRERVEAYARGESVFPVTMEIDLTQKCTRNCPQCPYGAVSSPGLTLSFSFLERLFGILGPQTSGLVLSGGEPTSAPDFPKIIALARRTGFKEIGVITNGSLLHKPEIQDALMEHATSVRISLYDWQEGETPYFRQELQNLENLRKRIDTEGSSLEIAASMLTRSRWIERIEPVGRAALSTGIHWLYFHPFCVKWDTPYPVQAEQAGVVEAVEAFKERYEKNSEIQFPYERYERYPLEFEMLHASHFLIQVGAGRRQLRRTGMQVRERLRPVGSERLPERRFFAAPGSISQDREDSIGELPAHRTRHRPPIFSTFIQSFIDGKADGEKVRSGSYHQPHII